MSRGDPTEHDDMLFHMLKECKTLPVFWDHIFGFLQRRTDFYHVATDSNSPVGLPEGLAEQLVRHAYFKWRPKTKGEVSVFQEDEIPTTFTEEVVLSEDNDEHVEDITIEEPSENGQVLQSNKPKSDIVFSSSESYNGAAYENYCWSQTILDVDITLKVPENVLSKDLNVSILTDKISVKMKNHTILEGELCQKCKHNDAIWSLDKKKLLIHLDKCKETWWDCLIRSENRLDVSKLDCSRPFEELSDDVQAKIEELGWNQERKRQGLPTSDELANQAVLRKAWDAKGSPFSGPFDPSQVKFN